MSERQLTPEQWAYNYDSVFHGERRHYMVTFWARVYDRLHPKHTQPGTNGRKICLQVLKKALNWHLENAISREERGNIAHALKEINTYAD
jgi:hypothetical protein